MITPFDKGGAAELYKEKFAECMADGDYEGGIDWLIKFSEERDNPHFHLAMGMLYLLMTQESDDSELIYMAYREFMLQIRRDPTCALAYRDLLATEFLRRDIPDVAMYAEWFDRRGIDVKLIIDELADADFFVPFSSEPFDFDYLFDEGEFGEIDRDFDPQIMLARGKYIKSYGYDELANMDEDKLNEIIAAHEKNTREYDIVKVLNGELDIKKKSKGIIRFDSGGASDGKTSGGGSKKVLDFDASVNDGEEAFRAEFMEQLLESLRTFTDGGESKTADVSEILDNNRLMRRAEAEIDAKRYDSALKILEGVSPESECYYYVLALRALIHLETCDISSAESAVNAALELKPDGALAGTMLCRLYELKGETSAIPQALKNIDVADFPDGDHVYRTVFDYVLKYCDERTALELMEDYIDEYNILDVRLIYALMMYNRGETSFALDELYALSRVFYDDINLRYFYIMARSGAEKLPVDNEAPQEALSLTVNTVIDAVECGLAFETVPESEEEIFGLFLEFFLSLEFRNEPHMLKKMFGTVKKLAASDKFDGKMRDALVSPYVEPIVKAIILSELMEKDRRTDFLAEVMYEPISSDCLKTLDGEFSMGYYKAYAFTAIMCPRAIDDLIAAAHALKPEKNADENAIAYRLFTQSVRRKIKLDERTPYAMGFPTKAAAVKAAKSVDAKQ